MTRRPTATRTSVQTTERATGGAGDAAYGGPESGGPAYVEPGDGGPAVYRDPSAPEPPPSYDEPKEPSGYRAPDESPSYAPADEAVPAAVREPEDPAVYFSGPSEAARYGEGPAGYGEGPAGYGEGPAGYGEGPAGYGEGPAGYGEGPAGYGEEPAGYGEEPSGYGEEPAGYGEEACAYGEEPPRAAKRRARMARSPAASGDATEPEPYLAPHDPNTGAQTVPFRGPFEPHPAQPKLSDLTVTDLLPAEMTSAGVDPVGVEVAASELAVPDLAGSELGAPDLADSDPDQESVSEGSREKLEKIKDLYLTVEAIGDDNVGKHFDELMQRQRELISDYFKETGIGSRRSRAPSRTRAARTYGRASRVRTAPALQRRNSRVRTPATALPRPHTRVTHCAASATARGRTPSAVRGRGGDLRRAGPARPRAARASPASPHAAGS